MKYVNPGYPQLFETQNLNDIVIGIDHNYELSNTGYYMCLSRNDNDVIYKVIDPTKEFYLLFDMILKQMNSVNHTMLNWVKILDFYNDKNPTKNIKLCYKQKQDNIYELCFFTNDNKQIGNKIVIQRNNLYTIELHVTRGNTTVIEIYINQKMKQSMLDANMGDDVINRISFYCNYVLDMDLCLSHFIYNDSERVGNERIKMLRTDMSQKIIANGTSASFLITEILNNVLYKDITGFGLVTSIENSDNVQTKIKEFLNTNQIKEYTVDSNKTKYNMTYLYNDPLTNRRFIPADITNRKILIETTKV